MFSLEQGWAALQPVVAALGSQSCACSPVHDAAHCATTPVSVLFTQHTVPGPQFAWAVHFRVTPFSFCCPPPGVGQVVPVTHEEVAAWPPPAPLPPALVTQQTWVAREHEAVPQGMAVVSPPGPVPPSPLLVVPPPSVDEPLDPLELEVLPPSFPP